VTSLNGINGVLGVKLSSLPWICHEPAVAGTKVGKGECVASGEERTTVIGAVGTTPIAFEVGVTWVTLSDCGAADVVGAGAAEVGLVVEGVTV